MYVYDALRTCAKLDHEVTSRYYYAKKSTTKLAASEQNTEFMKLFCICSPLQKKLMKEGRPSIHPIKNKELLHWTISETLRYTKAILGKFHIVKKCSSNGGELREYYSQLDILSDYINGILQAIKDAIPILKYEGKYHTEYLQLKHNLNLIVMKIATRESFQG